MVSVFFSGVIQNNTSPIFFLFEKDDDIEEKKSQIEKMKKKSEFFLPFQTISKKSDIFCVLWSQKKKSI